MDETDEQVLGFAIGVVVMVAVLLIVVFGVIALVLTDEEVGGIEEADPEAAAALTLTA